MKKIESGKLLILDDLFLLGLGIAREGHPYGKYKKTDTDENQIIITSPLPV
ncbi:hypothetical protein [Bacteroides acidifaciens]|uniref:hypothetical protein n=1 Tax=Bacteroides acidifaciens TaxID=85831 RepID=UPI003F68FEB7